MRTTRSVQLAAAAAAIAALAPAAASAATVTITGDDGGARPLSPTAPPTIRNMAPAIDVTLPQGSGRYSVALTDPANALAGEPARCQDPAQATRTGVPYRGNGTYRVTVTNFGFGDTACTTPVGAPEVYAFTIQGGVALQRRSPFLLRAPSSSRLLALALPIDLNPGAARHEVRYAKDARLRRDGAIRGRAGAGRVNAADRAALLTFRSPGVYTVVARALRDGRPTPWSRPVRIRAIAPFDLRSLRYTDRSGPVFRVVAQVREPSARGRVTIGLGGARGGFRTLGSTRIASNGTFVAGFRAVRAGTYRLRFSYGGGRTVARGTAIARFQVGTAIVGTG